MGGSGRTADCVLPLRSQGLKWQSLDSWAEDHIGICVGQGPALTLLSAAFLWQFSSLSIPPDKLVEGEMRPSPALGPEPPPCWDSPSLPGWHRETWVGQGGDKSLSKRRGWASWREQESCLCARWRAITVLVVLPGAAVPSWGLVPGQARALGWGQEHLFVRRAGGLNYQPAAGRLQAERARTAPGKPSAPLPRVRGGGLVWYLVLGSNLLRPSRNEGALTAVPWGVVADSIACRTPRAWVCFTFFPPLCRIAASPWILPHCSEPRLGLFIYAKAKWQQGPSLSGGLAELAGTPSAGSLQRGSCAVIRVAPDKSRAGNSPQGVLDHIKVAPGGAHQASWHWWACRPQV